MTTLPFRAVIFDMDGVVADSEPVYDAAFNIALEPLGKRVTPEIMAMLRGHGIEHSWRVLSEVLSLAGPLDVTISLYNDALIRTLAEPHETLPGVRELIAALRERGVPVGLASSSLLAWIESLLRGVGLSDAFDLIVSASMVAHPKPAPDIYLLAADRLGVDPAACIAIEDTPTGLTSAKAAGMFAVQVRSGTTAFPPQPMADVVLGSLLEFDLKLVSSS